MILTFFLIIIVLAIIAILLSSIFSSKCPNCKKFFVLKESERSIIKEERISKLEEHKTYNKKGEISGRREVRVYGTKTTYSVTYKCTNCNHTLTKVEIKEKY